MHIDFTVKTRSQDIRAQKVLRPRLCQRLLQDLRCVRELLTDVKVRQLSSHRETGDHHALDQLMRVLMHDVAVLEGARLRFIRVTNQVNRLRVRRRDEAPLHTGREPRTAASAQSRCLHLIRDRAALHRERLFQLVIAPILQIAFDGGIVPFSIDVAEDQPLLARMGFFAGKIGDSGRHGPIIGASRTGARGICEKFHKPSPLTLRAVPRLSPCSSSGQGRSSLPHHEKASLLTQLGHRFPCPQHRRLGSIDADEPSPHLHQCPGQ